VSPKTEERTYVIVAANKQELYVWNALLGIVGCNVAWCQLRLHTLFFDSALIWTCIRAEWVQSINLVADPNSAQRPFVGEMLSSWKMDPVSLREGYLLKRGIFVPIMPCM